jgi:glycolate oxidase FAD binding subunit
MTAAIICADTVRDALPSARECEASDYPIDGLLPGYAFRPETRDEVATLLAAATDARQCVVPQGARTALRLGRPLAAYDVALDTTGLDRLVAYEPEDLTLTVEAGMTLARLQALLGERGQYLPVEPPPSDHVTIGGLLAPARSGGWRGHLPAARDLVLGATVATAEGTLVKSGGRVVKNVSGYDMHRMHAGALGAFGVIVEASFKLASLPPAHQSFAIRCTHLEQAAEAAYAFWDAALPLRALSLLAPAAAHAAGLDAASSPSPVPGEGEEGDPPAAYVLLECAGNEAVIARTKDAVHKQAVLLRATAADVIDDAPWTNLRALAGSEDATVLRLGVPASKLVAAINAATDAGCTAWGHLASGAVIATAPHLDAATVRQLRAHAAEARGFLQVESAPASLRAEVGPFGPGERDLVRALKQQFDPHGTINRGRWMEGV